MIEVRNLTAAAIGILPGILIPAHGSKRISASDYKAALKTAPFQARLNAGQMIATDLSAFARVEDPHTAPEPAAEPSQPSGAADAAADPQSGTGGAQSEPREPFAGVAAQQEQSRDDLIAEASRLGITVNRRWKDETLARKIAEAKG